MTEHGAFSIITDIKPGMQQALTEVLAVIDKTTDDVNGIVPFRKLVSIHYARFVILNARTDAFGKPLPAGLVFTTDYDLPYDNHIQELVDYAGKGLWQVFSHCTNFPGAAYDPLKLKQYLEQNDTKSNTFYIGVGFRSVEQIRNESLLRDEIEQYVDKNQEAFEQKSAGHIREQIITYLNSKPELRSLVAQESKASFSWNLKYYGSIVLVILLAILFLPVLLPFLIIWVIIVFIHELKDDPANNVVTKQHLRELQDRETGMVQAQFSAVGNIKPGWVRLQTMKKLLLVVNFMAPYLFTKGKLSGIPTVHFARWLIINDGKQLLFLSNYDGNSESYLTDFINIAGRQLTLIFSHTTGYPKTWFMIFGGAKDAQKFLEWAKHYQTITNVWYSANKGVSVNNIYKNSKIKEGLSGSLNEHEAAKWLSLI